MFQLRNDDRVPVGEFAVFIYFGVTVDLTLGLSIEVKCSSSEPNNFLWGQCRGAGIELFICGSSIRPLEQIFSVSIISLWVEPSTFLAFNIIRLSLMAGN